MDLFLVHGHAGQDYYCEPQQLGRYQNEARPDTQHRNSRIKIMQPKKSPDPGCWNPLASDLRLKIFFVICLKNLVTGLPSCTGSRVISMMLSWVICIWKMKKIESKLGTYRYLPNPYSLAQIIMNKKQTRKKFVLEPTSTGTEWMNFLLYIMANKKIVWKIPRSYNYF